MLARRVRPAPCRLKQREEAVDAQSGETHRSSLEAVGALAKAGDLAIEQLSEAARAAFPDVIREL
jgi:hypothetical protein